MSDTSDMALPAGRAFVPTASSPSVSPVPASIPSAARTLFLECCLPGSPGTLQRYGEACAVTAILSVLDRDRLIDLLSVELGDSYDCTRVWSAWGYGTMGEDDFELVANRVADMADGIIEALLASAIEARRAETGTGSVHESAVPQADAHA